MDSLSEQTLTLILKKEILANDLSTEELSLFCEYANENYRAGNPIVSDEDYDFIFLKELKKEILNIFF